MPAGGAPPGLGHTILVLLGIFAVGGAVGIIYRVLRRNTIRENGLPLAASVVVLGGFVATVEQSLSFDVFLLGLAASSAAVASVGLE
ncbi:hypothetical protein [Halococcus sp. IIIV-5B]|uniref:hypothetical protein n=1 Tax=Halococcus sp. IIIV-5B TaxID=2321230 RepID=UPI000E73391C|nr:hypothetical protein [Halococcus sp. IIIV-5B]RJT04052.1 hypothetical protein D3261_09760 [Halococcus sp. IIIV-5B]